MTIRFWGTEFNTGAPDGSNHTDPVVCALSNGGYVIAWDDNATARFQIFDGMGNAVGIVHSAQIPHNSNLQALQSGISVTGLADGNFIIGFQYNYNSSDYNTAAEEFGSSGNYIQTFNLDSTTNATSAPGIASFGTGWIEATESNGNVYFATDLSDGTIGAGSPVNVTTTANTDSPAVAAYSDLEAVAWVVPSTGHVEATFLQNGTALLGMTEFTAVDFGGKFAVADHPHVAFLDYSHAVIAYNALSLSGYFVGFAVCDTEGNVVGSSYIFPPGGAAGATAEVSVIACSRTQFLLSWTEATTLTSEIHAQLFNLDGSAAGQDIIVNSDAAGIVHASSLGLLHDGRVVVTWQTNSDPASNGFNAIHQQILDPRDGSVWGSSDPTIVETLYGNNAFGDDMHGLAGNDTLYGLGGNDQLYGDDGNDTLNGGLGDDSLYGGTGDDVLIGGPGADTLDGGSGNNTASYATATARVTISLDGQLVAKGDAAGDTLVNIENLVGSAYTDRLCGNSNANAIDGSAGNDTIQGAGGADTLTGGNGNDSFVYSKPSEGHDTITDFSNIASNNDRFVFTGANFGHLAAGSLAADEFQSSTSNVALTASDRFFFETDTGILYYDPDGSGSRAAVVIATVQPGAVVTVDDIHII